MRRLKTSLVLLIFNGTAKKANSAKSWQYSHSRIMKTSVRIIHSNMYEGYTPSDYKQSSSAKFTIIANCFFSLH